MKSSHLKYVILLLMGAVIWVGTRETPPTDFEVAHAGMVFPDFDENEVDCSCGKATPENLLSPSTQLLNDYEAKLFEFVLSRAYEFKPYGWCRDKKVRATGPFLAGKNYNFHGAARIYYSPRMMYWLTGNPKYMKNVGIPGKKYEKRTPRTGDILDGAMIIKEGYPLVSDFYDQLKELAKRKSKDPNEGEEWYEEVAKDLIWSISIMVKDSKGSKGGWFWSSVSPQDLLSTQPLTSYIQDSTLSKYSVSAGMNSDFNLPCTRCHGSALDEMTFSDLTNIDGVSEEDQKRAGVFGKNILRFQTDVSWKDSAHIEGIEHYRGFSFENAISTFPTCVQDSLTVKEFRDLFYLPKLMRPWTDTSIIGIEQFFSEHRRSVDPTHQLVTGDPLEFINPGFVVNFPEIKGMTYADTKKFPFQWADHVVPKPGKKLDHYITSDNCMGCHGGLGYSPYDLTMFIKTGPEKGEGYNVSEFGEWRWSPMGLAGRDPIFFSQLESEMALLETDAQKGRLFDGKDSTQLAVRNTCLSCHGAMGERQLQKDVQKGMTKPNGEPLVADLQVDYLYLTEAISSTDTVLNDKNYAYHKYGELAREGISCTICHHISAASDSTVMAWNPKNPGWLPKTKNPITPLKPSTSKELAYFLFHNNTGRYVESPADELNGPFKDVKKKPMQQVLGISPVHNEFTSDSKMCGTCHTINLPNIGPMPVDTFPVLTAAAGNPVLAKYGHSIEQATFLEWQNSAYGFSPDNKKNIKEFRSCQSCHMPNNFENLAGDVKVDKITTKIATVQDASYAFSPNQLPNEDLTLYPRSDFKRHELVGLNVFLLEMFDQFPGILGVNETDYMTSAKNGNTLAIENMLRQARDSTVDVKAKAKSISKDKKNLEVDVKVTSKVGHRFPSGVAFRRAFLELLVMDKDGHVIWGSGRTNHVGVITDSCGIPLKTEFLPDTFNYQKHYQVINYQNQVQIYEELNINQDNHFTTSFIHRNVNMKDNRLLPKGYRHSSAYKEANQGEVIYEFMKATDPHRVDGDPDYKGGKDFKGEDNIKYRIKLPDGFTTDDVTVKATMYYQAIPPFWLHQRFSLAPNGDATKRLYYMTSHLDLSDTPMKDWKLPLVSDEVKEIQ